MLKHACPAGPMNSPFKRATCACAQCVECCRRQPGALAAGDYERIQAHLGISSQEMAKLFCASPGAVVMNSATGALKRIGSITPQRRRGRCVFLNESDRCTIHEVAPFGCTHFDTHMGLAAGQERGIWLARSQDNPDYQ